MVVQMSVKEFEAAIQKAVQTALAAAPSAKPKKEKKSKDAAPAAAEDGGSVSSRKSSEAQAEWKDLSIQVTALVAKVKAEEMALWEKNGKDDKSKPSYAQGFHLKVGGRVKVLAKEREEPLASFVDLDKIRGIVAWLRANPDYKSANALKEPKVKAPKEVEGEKKKVGRPKKVVSSPAASAAAPKPKAAAPPSGRSNAAVFQRAAEAADEDEEEVEQIKINGVLYFLDPKTNILYEDVDGAMGEAAGRLNEDGDEMIAL
jgi:hypothetical protein